VTAPLLALSGSNLTGDVPFSCALAAGGAVHEAASPAGARGDLAALVAGVCARAGVAPAGVRRVRVDVGPGSYTGLRVALTFVRFLQGFGGAAVEAVDSLALLAARGRPPGGAARRVRTLLDARRERVHTQVFDVAPDAVTPVAPAAALPLAAVLAALAPGETVLVPASLPAALRAALEGGGARVEPQHRVTAAAMLREPLPFWPAAPAQLEPRYLMASYAE
jgi:tRNA threonylcarbamoyladenosine biosynthesis protein TsaB